MNDNMHKKKVGRERNSSYNFGKSLGLEAGDNNEKIELI
jgi:hypothetical protein